jgi:hypothetical protein
MLMRGDLLQAPGPAQEEDPQFTLHPCGTYGVVRPREMLESTALGRRSLIKDVVGAHGGGRNPEEVNFSGHLTWLLTVPRDQGRCWFAWRSAQLADKDEALATRLPYQVDTGATATLRPGSFARPVLLTVRRSVNYD